MSALTCANCPVVLKKERCISWQSCSFSSDFFSCLQHSFLLWSLSLSSFPQQPYELVAHNAEHTCMYSITTKSMWPTLLNMMLFFFISRVKIGFLNKVVMKVISLFTLLLLYQIHSAFWTFARFGTRYFGVHRTGVSHSHFFFGGFLFCRTFHVFIHH